MQLFAAIKKQGIACNSSKVFVAERFQQKVLTILAF
jgi:hypothetical protein